MKLFGTYVSSSLNKGPFWVQYYFGEVKREPNLENYPYLPRLDSKKGTESGE